MTALAHDGKVVWYWAPAVAGTPPAYAPTVAQITASTRILRITDFQTPSSEAEVDTADIDTIYDTSVVGTSKVGPIVLTMKRDDTSEVGSWDLFVFRTNGFLIKSKNGVAILASKVEVYPVQTGQKRVEGYGRNATQKFSVSFYVTSQPNLDATVAA